MSTNQPTVPQVSSPQVSVPLQPSYYSQFLTPQQPAYAAPVQMQMPQVQQSIAPATFNSPVPVTRFVPPTMPAPQAPPMFAQPQVRPPVQQQQIPQPPSPQSPPVMDWYGRAQDPLHFALFQPPPFRQQMTGETFMERFAKNLLLDLGTMAFFHAGLALRQMILPPTPPHAPEKTINGP